MRNPADLALDHWSDWGLLAVGLAILLLPGLAAADRLIPRRRGLLLAPVLSFTILPVAAILLDFLFAVPVTASTTTLLALGLGLLLGRHRLRDWLSSPAALALPAPPAGLQPIRISYGARLARAFPTVLGLLLLASLLGLVHSLPHIPDDDANSPGALDALAGRALLALDGKDHPYPIHVDEHAHMARAAQVVRSQTTEIVDPYSGEPLAGSLLSLEGNVHERGFEVALAQLHLLTSLPWGVIFRFGAAAWAAYLGVLAWGLAKPHVGAAAGALALVALPTSPMFLGVGFLVPIGAGLAWVAGTLWVSSRCDGMARLGGTFLLITGGFFIHLVAGAICIVVALAAAAVRADSWRERAIAGTATLLPLAWIGPAIESEVTTRVTTEVIRPSGREIFLFAGPVAPILAVLATIWAFWRPNPSNQVHRVAAISFAVLLITINVSLQTGSRSLALYYRPIHATFFLGAIVAGYGAGQVGAMIARWLGGPHSDLWLRARVAAFAALLVMGVGLPAVAAQQMDMQYYRVFDEESWNAGAVFAHSGAGPTDQFLSHPWRAPVYNAFTGAQPVAVLYPGSPPAGGSLFNFYERTNGANQGWLDSYELDWVLSRRSPNGGYEKVTDSLYKLT